MQLLKKLSDSWWLWTLCVLTIAVQYSYGSAQGKLQEKDKAKAILVSNLPFVLSLNFPIII